MNVKTNFLYFFLIFLIGGGAVIALSAPAYAVPSSLSITAAIGSSGVGDTMRVYVYYTDNASNTISYAACTISGGFLSNVISLTYNSVSGYYYYDLYLSSAGSSTFSLSCSKTGYDSASGSTIINVPKGSSTLSVYDIPDSGDVGGVFTVRADYRNSNSKISGATCKMDVIAPSGAKDTIFLSETGGDYKLSYSFASAGSYSFVVLCSSGNYQSQSRQFNSQIKKKSASIQAAQAQSSYYAEQPIDLNYYYRDGGGSNIFGAQCSYELRKGNSLVDSGKMLAVSTGYRIDFSGFDYGSAQYTIQVLCETSEYQKQSVSQTFSILEIPATVRIETNAPKGDYSYNALSISALYRATNSGNDISGALCLITLSEENKSFEGAFYKTTYPLVEKPTSLTIRACCSKKNYEGNCIDAFRQVMPQPIFVEPLTTPSEFVSGETYLLGVRASPSLEGDIEQIKCTSFAAYAGANAISKEYALERNSTAHSTKIFFETPGRVQITYLCSGPGFAETKIMSEIRVKVFKKESETTLFTVLGALGALLSVALIIITRKYKV